uniref:Uncharacterized protein n=2 Tax=Capitella teleta TaxID=283909 RepID=X2AIB4_CAPTE
MRRTIIGKKSAVVRSSILKNSTKVTSSLHGGSSSGIIEFGYFVFEDIYYTIHQISGNPMPITRSMSQNSTSKTPDEAQSMSDVAQETLTETRQMDPLWEKLMRLPFFAEADMGEKRQMYREEQEREERRKEQEREEEEVERQRQRQFELEKLRLTSSSKPRSPHVHAVSLPPWEEKTKMDKYLSTCERLLDASKVDQEVWVAYILPKLPEKARTVYNRMPADRANVYPQLKRSLLDSYAISPFVYRQNFFGWKKRVAC